MHKSHLEQTVQFSRARNYCSFDLSAKIWSAYIQEFSHYFLSLFLAITRSLTLPLSYQTPEYFKCFVETLIKILAAFCSLYVEYTRVRCVRSENIACARLCIYIYKFYKMPLK